MIGFMFKGRDRARLVELETQFTARALGGDVAYEGRGMCVKLTPPSRSSSGTFSGGIRFCERHSLPMPLTVAEAWLGHTRALQRAVMPAERRDLDCQSPIPLGGPPPGGRTRGNPGPTPRLRARPSAPPGS